MSGALGGIRAIIAEGGFREFSAGELRIGFTNETTMHQAAERFTDGRLQQAASAYFGQPIVLVAQTAGSGEKGQVSPAAKAREEAAHRHAEREDRARNHPKMSMVESIFPGAEITRIRHLVD